MQINLLSNKKIYFASDFHLGVPDAQSSLDREKRIINFLDDCSKDAQTIFLVGDLFDFWFEYKHTVPKGYTRFIGKLSALVDAGIEIVIFTGNHDMWMNDYFIKEVGATIYHDPIKVLVNNKKLFIGHGDGLGPGDHSYKFLKKVFRNPFLQWCFNWLHPNIGISVANYWSKRSRAQANDYEEKFLGEDEWLWTFAKEKEQEEHHDCYIFGHRHLPIDVKFGENSRYLNLGEWINFNTYVEFDGDNFELKTFES
jgi:UDP-2,3-diacylglucosamine hydrolase